MLWARSGGVQPSAALCSCIPPPLLLHASLGAVFTCPFLAQFLPP